MREFTAKDSEFFQFKKDNKVTVLKIKIIMNDRDILNLIREDDAG